MPSPSPASAASSIIWSETEERSSLAVISDQKNGVRFVSTLPRYRVDQREIVHRIMLHPVFRITGRETMFAGQTKGGMVVDKAVSDPIIAMLTHGVAKMVKRLLCRLRRHDAFNISLQIFHYRTTAPGGDGLQCLRLQPTNVCRPVAGINEKMAESGIKSHKSGEYLLSA